MNGLDAAVRFRDELRTLAVFGDERLEAAPDVPTAVEQASMSFSARHGSS
jgi:tripartite-type tricarboxylate transporter receptor subunit TctC